VTHVLFGLRACLADGLVQALPHLGLAVVFGACWAALGARLIETFTPNAPVKTDRSRR